MVTLENTLLSGIPGAPVAQYQEHCFIQWLHVGIAMSADVLPDEVKAFLLRYIDSVAQLEALLLLRANADLAWSADILALRLYTSVQDTAELLARLCADGFLAAQDSEPPLYQYHCPSRDQAHMVDQVAMLYTKYLIPVTHLIHAKPRTRVQGFADAFRFRKDT